MLSLARGAGDGEAGFDERDAVEAGEPEGEGLGAGRVAAGAEVGLEGVGLVRGAARELADADGGAAEWEVGIRQPLGAEGVGPGREALVVGVDEVQIPRLASLARDDTVARRREERGEWRAHGECGAQLRDVAEHAAAGLWSLHRGPPSPFPTRYVMRRSGATVSGAKQVARLDAESAGVALDLGAGAESCR